MGNRTLLPTKLPPLCRSWHRTSIWRISVVVPGQFKHRSWMVLVTNRPGNGWNQHWNQSVESPQRNGYCRSTSAGPMMPAVAWLGRSCRLWFVRLSDKWMPRSLSWCCRGSGRGRLLPGLARYFSVFTTFSATGVVSTCPSDRLPPVLLVAALGLILEDQRGGAEGCRG